MKPSLPPDRPDSEMAGQSPTELHGMLTTSRHRTRWRNIGLAVIGVVIVTFLILWATGIIAFKSASEQQPRYLKAPVTRGDMETSISATGNLEALNTVEVGSEVSGRIRALHVDFNDPVTQGQLLAEVDPEQLQASLEQASAQVVAANAGVDEAQASLTEAQRDAARSKELADKGLLSRKELDSAVAKAARARASLVSARASARTAQASFDAAKTRLDKTSIRSPIRGTVLSRLVEVGQTINAGMQTPVLFTIAEDLKSMRLSTRVDEADIASVAVDQTASFTVDAYPDRTFASRVVAVRNVAQTEQNVVSYEVLLSVENPDLLLKPGMTATVEIVTMSQKDALLVPNKALRFQPPGATTSFRGAPRPPGMPFIGGQGRGVDQKDPAAASKASVGKIEARQGIVWILDQDTPTAIKVSKVATNGDHTAVTSPQLREGMEVLTELADQGTAKK